MIGCGKYPRAIGGEHIRNSESFRYRARGELQRARGDDQIKSARGVGQYLELSADCVDGELAQLVRGWLNGPGRLPPARELLQVGPNRNTSYSVGLHPVLEIGSDTQTRLVPQRSQLTRQRQDGLYISSRAYRGKQHFHIGLTP